MRFCFFFLSFSTFYWNAEGEQSKPKKKKSNEINFRCKHNRIAITKKKTQIYRILELEFRAIIAHLLNNLIYNCWKMFFFFLIETWFWDILNNNKFRLVRMDFLFKNICVWGMCICMPFKPLSEWLKFYLCDDIGIEFDCMHRTLNDLLNGSGVTCHIFRKQIYNLMFAA